MELAGRLQDMMLAFGREAEIPVEVVGDNVIISIDDFVECAVAPAKVEGLIEFRAPLFAFGPENRDRLFEQALKLNLGGDGIAVAVSDRGPILLIRRTVTAEGLQQREFEEALKGFVAATRLVRDALADSAKGERSDAESPRPNIDVVLLRA